MEQNTNLTEDNKKKNKKRVLIGALVGFLIFSIVKTFKPGHIPGYERREIIGSGVTTHEGLSVPAVIIVGGDGLTHAVSIEGAKINSNVSKLEGSYLYYKLTDEGASIIIQRK